MTTHESAVSHPPRTALLTVDEAADFLRISRRQVYKLVRRGDVRAVRVGERLRLRPEEVDDYLERNREAIP